MPKKFSYYVIDKIMSLNAVFNFIMGARGLGKTYGFKKYVLDQFFKHGHQFIYLRRFDTEMESARQFFVDIESVYPNYDFRVNGRMFECSPVSERETKKRQWKIMGFAIALTQAQKLKSVPYTHVTNIIFDEFILEKSMNHYLPGEARTLMNFYSTVDRGQDKTRVWFLANSVSINNPYFIQWRIRPDEGELFRMAEGFIACHFPDSKDFRNEMYETRFGKFVKGTDFAEFAIESGFADNHLEMVRKKPEDAKYYCTLELPLGSISIWYYGSGYYHAQQKLPVNQNVFTLMEENMTEDKTLITYSDKLTGNLRTAFRHARITFDQPETRNIFLDIFKR